MVRTKLRQMAELERKGMSGDEIASRFGIERQWGQSLAAFHFFGMSKLYLHF